MIDVDHHQRQRRMASRSAPPFEVERGVELAAVRGAGERIGRGDAMQRLDGRGEMRVRLFEIALERGEMDRAGELAGEGFECEAGRGSEDVVGRALDLEGAEVF